MAQVEKTVDADTAYDLYVKSFPLELSVDSKFSGDHLLAAPNMSKKTSIAAAIERYVKNQSITTSSWMLLDNSTVLNKAKSAAKRARIYRGEQQLAVNIKVVRRTVEIEKLTFKEAQRIENTEVTVKGEKQYLNCSSKEATVAINVVGGWDPLEGTFGLYHYEEGALPNGNQMVAKYLKWIYDEDSKEYIKPVAKK